jgi:hypothetical protein
MFIECVAEDTLVLADTPQRVLAGTATDAITVTDTAAGAAGSFSLDELDLNETVSLAGSSYGISLSDSLTLVERALGGIYKPCILDATVPPLGSRTTTILAYPYTTPTYSVSLRNPKFGNKQIQEIDVILRKTRGGEQVVGTEPTWLTTTYIEVSFEALTQAQRDDLIELLEASAGDEIKLIDWENRTWRGVIVSNPNEIVQVRDDGNSYEASFKFEGVLVP